jgi:beta-barrel assembly-enhancing protease
MRIPVHILLIASLALSSCARKSSDRYREGDNTGQKAALTVEEERKLTQEALSQMKKEYPPVQNTELQAYIDKLGQKIVQANKLGNNPYTYNFTVVDVANVNAFALPAGTIYMTAPIIAMADSEAEIAGVLGHEIGHVTARHTAERMYVAKKEKGKTWLLGGVGAAVGGAAGIFLGNKFCPPKDTQCRAKFAVYGLGGGAGAGLLVHKYGFMQNSREDELESDRVGFRYAVNAGYDKEKVGDFYQKLLAMEQESKKGQNALLGWLSDAMATHPPSKERVKQSEELKRKINTSGGISSTDEFVRMRKIARDIVEKAKQRSSGQQATR